MADAVLLLVGGDHDDVLLFSEALAISGVGARLQTVSDEPELLSYLDHCLAEDDPWYVWPGVVVFDLGAATGNGLGTLERMRADGRLSSLPVAILTATVTFREGLRARELGAACFTKSAQLHDRLQFAHRLKRYFEVDARRSSAAA